VRGDGGGAAVQCDANKYFIPLNVTGAMAAVTLGGLGLVVAMQGGVEGGLGLGGGMYVET